ncbi:C40 family peptidase [Actinocrinis puniceicyclus]|uniref:C40 family peptidase n=1 Tax=Actinocrinis puniceicyclus TaxID=977794 RepID=A0A8J7WKG7_9ACTN|nr:C40 family peptidase [Actinocrinis puniceicyclus]MBS2962525.1 C40 family peptidase [Actinocrinis puniceicyclus]
MHKLTRHHSEPTEHFASRARRRAVATALAPLLAATTSLLISPATADATVRHTHHRAAAHTSGHHASKRPAHRKTTSAPHATAIHGSRGAVALRFAVAQLGKPYRWGATGPGSYDCSGLTQRAWRAAGVSIPRTTQAQARFGTPVPLSRIQPGDLVIFYANASHVGIYAGHGKVIVAPHRGKAVSYALMRWMPIYAIRRPG